jgi:hypothetical protein
MCFYRRISKPEGYEEDEKSTKKLSKERRQRRITNLDDGLRSGIRFEQ